ncbi:hypothetical protein HU200_025547 [Digitaria exilis]|uniref:RNase H type-1 domain-containing protein n=1 Tax=Digitaria exilis TaxID=1010633 RepID=A0A835EW50_9POAL|nr:hypothetical protein HU200_025547 [Digitaria exilis]
MAGESISIEGSVIFLRRYMDSLVQFQRQSAVQNEKSSTTTQDLRWGLLDPGSVKINTDGAFSPSSGAASLGVIIRDHLGQPLLTAWRKLFHCRDAEEAEAAACLDGVRLAGRWPEKNVVLEVDCAALVDKLQSQELDRSLVAPLVHDIKEVGRQMNDFQVVKCRREQNKITHELARLASRSGQSRVSFSVILGCVQDLVLSERAVMDVNAP